MTDSATAQRQRATVAIGDYELGPQIGRGSFATVYRGVNKKTNTLVAIKSVVRSSLTRRLLENLETEINILRTVKHPGVVSLLDCLKSRNHIHLVMEYCSLGDLAGYMRKRKEHPSLRNPHGGLNQHIVRHFVVQLGAAMRYLRSRDIIHRDIKTQNILLLPNPASLDHYEMGVSEEAGEYPMVKIADFGFARNLPASALAETLCGSPLYMAPEILHYEPYDAKADLWSIGAVIYEMMAGRPPFHASNHVELARVIERTNDKISFPDERPSSSSNNGNNSSSSNGNGEKEPLDPQLKDLVRGLLRMKPASRMSFDDFFAHPALQPLDSNGDNISSINNAAPELVATGAVADVPLVSTVDSPRIHAADRTKPQEFADKESTLERQGENQHFATHTTTAPAYPPQQQHHHQRASVLAEAEQALAEREYVVIEKRAVEMNVLADALESSPRTPITFYPPRPNAMQQAPGVARQMTALARAIHNAVSSQYQISRDAAVGPLDSQAVADKQQRAGGVLGKAARHGVFNPLDVELAETFESRYSHGTQAEEPVMRRMEGLAYRAFAMSYLADLKWNQLPVATSPGRRTQQQPQQRDPLADPDTGFLTATTLTIEDAFVLYLKALSLLHCAMVEASRHWASLQGDIATSPSSPAVVVSTAFNTSVQWVRNKFNLCLDRAESLKQFANGHVILDDPSQVSIIQVLYEQALALSKAAAVRELKWIDPLDCDRAYQLAIWMLSAILVSGNTSSSSNSSSSSSPNASHQQQHHRRERDAGEDDADDDIDPEDRTLIEQFIASIVKRREALQRRLLAMQETGSS